MTALDTGSEDLLAEVDALERPRSECGHWAASLTGSTRQHNNTKDIG